MIGVKGIPVANSENALRSAPSDWDTFHYVDDLDLLLQMTSEAPLFDPAWVLLSRKYSELGRKEDCTRCEKKYMELTAKRSMSS